MSLLTAPAPRSQLELPAVSFFGRTFEEYTRFFDLNPNALYRLAVLDVAAGPSSFAAEAQRRGIETTAVDPLYAEPHRSLSARVRTDYAKMFSQMRAKPRLFKLKSFTSIDAAEIDRRAAARRFLADYEGNVRHARYVRASLPSLPFLDQSFSLVLCAHLLFIYAAQFDYDWHLAACKELVRVATREVKIHPVCGADGKPYPQLERLRADLAVEGISSEVVRVNYEFFAGGHSMLVLRRDRMLKRSVVMIAA
ncbi:class I SAM-dependent methyltransferase [Oleiharenicola lentus]|uniref:class I SAM-dependent methyltransferase n=1 Tax=Oleiharenicola lentus TaxID=2508720 RepID=UPI003F67830B